MEIESISPFLALAVSLLGAALIVATRHRPNVREACSLAAGTAQLVVVVAMIPAVLEGDTLHFTISEFLPEASLALRADALGVLFAATASALWILTTLFSIGYLRSLNEHAQTRFYTFFALSLTATMGVAFAANLVTLYLFYEILTFTTYPLVAHEGDEDALAGGRRYIAYQLGTGIALMFPAIILTFTLAGTFDFRAGGVFPSGASSTLLVVVYVLFLAGTAKAAIMPFHQWLPAAMVAPVPVSALLHAVAVVNAGVFTVLRVIFDVFGVDLMQRLNLGIVTAVVASITILVASFYALKVDSLKGLLAYSTIGQLSYMILGAALLSPAGMRGGVMHIANHSMSKITLFFCTGAIYVRTRKTQVSELDGVGRLMPWTMAAFLVGALSIVGIPPTAGFITKYNLAIGSFEAGQFPAFLVLVVGTLISAAYYLRIARRAFFAPAPGNATPAPQHEGEPRRGEDPGAPREASPLLLVPLLVTAAMSLALGVYPRLLVRLVEAALP